MPDIAVGLNNRGVELSKSGRVREAIETLMLAISADPTFGEAHNNLGIALARVGREEEAIAHYRHALSIKPLYPEAHNNLGISLVKSGRLDEACGHFREALRIKEDYPEAYNNLANALRQQGDIENAIEEYNRAISLNPEYAEAHNNLANALAESDRFDEAVPHYEMAIHLKPRYFEAHNNLGNALARLGNRAEAERCYHRALRHNPDYAEAYSNLGNTLSDLGRLAEAVACYRQAIALKPDYAEAYNNLGIALGKQQKHPDAALAYANALQLKPEYPDAHLNRALGWLMSGNFEQGWSEYEWRWQCRDIKRFAYGQPVWTGESLDGKTILLYYEQGLGDTLQFVRYARLVKSRGGTVLLECQPQLVPFLSSCPGIDRLIPKGSPLPDFDVHCALLSLPKILRTTLESVPNEVPYLYANPNCVSQWKGKLKHLKGFRIGINWQGNTQYKGDHHRSFPIEHFGALAQIPDVHLISLQKGNGANQLAAFAEKYPITTLGDDFDEGNGAFVDTAAVMMNLDLVISSDTSLVHLAGGLGVPVWLPLSWSADWRWMEEREDSPWYPSMRLFRQAEPGDWDEVFSRIATQVKVISSKPRPRSLLTVEVSAGELLDKISILQLKAERMTDEAQLKNVLAELTSLANSAARTIEITDELVTLTGELKGINQKIWDAVDNLHKCERDGTFDEKFIAWAREISIENDMRADIKRRINTLLQSKLVEEKYYTI